MDGGDSEEALHTADDDIERRSSHRGKAIGTLRITEMFFFPRLIVDDECLRSANWNVLQSIHFKAHFIFTAWGNLMFSRLSEGSRGFAAEYI